MFDFENSRVLVVDDDPKIRAIISDALQMAGFTVEGVGDGEAMSRALMARAFSLVLLDIGLPGRSGLELVREVRMHSSAPVIFVTGRSADVDRIVGLEIGADDYIVKPFNVREVAARVRAVLRRVAEKTLAETSKRPAFIQFGDITISPRTRSFRGPAGELIILTEAEFALLEYLHSKMGEVCSRDEITVALKGHDWSPSDRSLDTLMARLRKKIEKDPEFPIHLVTIRGAGYKMNID